MSTGRFLQGPSAVPRMVGARHAANIGRVILPNVSVQRPNDSTQYAVGDLYGQPMKIENARRVAGGGTSLAVGVSIETTKAFPASLFWVFAEAPDARADNAPFAGTLSDAETAMLLAVTPISSFLKWASLATFGLAASDGGNWVATSINAVNTTILSDSVAKPVLAGRDLWVVVTPSAIYTPDALERLTLYPSITYAT